MNIIKRIYCHILKFYLNNFKSEIEKRMDYNQILMVIGAWRTHDPVLIKLFYTAMSCFVTDSVSAELDFLTCIAQAKDENSDQADFTGIYS